LYSSFDGKLTKERKFSTTQHRLVIPDENSVFFNARFNSGNLERAIRRSKNVYELYMAQDPHSDGYFTQWFFFSTRNLKRGQKVTFKLVNFTKKDSLANYGMRPCVYSLKKEADSGEGWHRSETGEARYYRNFEEVRSSTYCLENGKPVEDEEAKEFTIGDTGLFSMKFKNLYTMEF